MGRVEFLLWRLEWRTDANKPKEMQKKEQVFEFLAGLKSY